MENLEMINKVYKGRNVLITGHTGFKGSWLSLWLNKLGAHVSGYSLAPSTEPNIFSAIKFFDGNNSLIGDIRDKKRFESFIMSVNPEIIFHLAAQPIVLESYRDPADTYASNITGLVNLFEIIRKCDSVKSVMVITSDKCYFASDNRKKYSEKDCLGGIDPYSASKACAEIISGSYYHSFFRSSNKLLSTARAGNIIGGGDWSQYRIIPDIVRAVTDGKEITLRYPESVRPWQHILDALYGYLLLGSGLLRGLNEYTGPWNFGPDDNDDIKVTDLCSMFEQEWNVRLTRKIVGSGDNPYESGYLALDNSKSRKLLGWKPLWNIRQSVTETVRWYKEYYIEKKDSSEICLNQIDNYIKIKTKKIEHY